MSDIVKDAKRLLEGVTSGKWRAADSDIIAEDSNRFIATVSEYSGLDEPSEECANVQLIAAAPELAQALAEETYEYAVQAKTGSRWEYKQDGFFRDAWFSELRKAKAGARELRSIGKETRIVLRRVSPPEVINE